MGFIFETLATFLAGMISQHHQNGRMGLARFFCIFWIIFFIGLLLAFVLDGPFKSSDFMLAIIGATSIAGICWAVMYCRFLIIKNSKSRQS